MFSRVMRKRCTLSARRTMGLLHVTVFPFTRCRFRSSAMILPGLTATRESEATGTVTEARYRNYSMLARTLLASVSGEEWI